MKKHMIIPVMTILLFAGFQIHSMACTNFLVTKGASADGSVMITYSADSHTLYGELYFRPAKDYPAGAMVDVYEWDTGKLLGKIPQAKHTYSVVGNMNEYQVSIGETTYGGREELFHQKGAIVDYGSMMYMALQRAKTAKEAIKVMTELVAAYGYQMGLNVPFYFTGNLGRAFFNHECCFTEFIGEPDAVNFTVKSRYLDFYA